MEKKFYEQIMDINEVRNKENQVQEVLLFNVMARENELQHKGMKIAEVMLDSDLTTSAFGDQRLFF